MDKQKPITVAIDDCKKDIAKLINDSNLPLCVLEFIVRDIYNEIHILSDRQLQEDREKYTQQNAENEEKTN